MVLPVYPAGEEPIDGVDTRHLTLKIHAHGHKEVMHVESFEQTIRQLKDLLKPDDVLLTLGAGDVYKLGELLLHEVEKGA